MAERAEELRKVRFTKAFLCGTFIFLLYNNIIAQIFFFCKKLKNPPSLWRIIYAITEQKNLILPRHPKHLFHIGQPLQGIKQTVLGHGNHPLGNGNFFKFRHGSILRQN